MEESPLGNKYPSYLNSLAQSEWISDKIQYPQVPLSLEYYKNADIKSIDTYDLDRHSSKDISALSYSRFLSGNGDINYSCCFNMQNDENKLGNQNKELWYYNANGGAELTPQNVNNIILIEAQRGGVNTSNLVKYNNKYGDCNMFDYNSKYSNNVFDNTSPYEFDYSYLQKIHINRK
jgi:hypothetical protein